LQIAEGFPGECRRCFFFDSPDGVLSLLLITTSPILVFTSESTKVDFASRYIDYAYEKVDLIKAGKLPQSEAMDLTGPTSEGVVLMNQLEISINRSLNNVWYAPSGQSNYSRMFSWGVQAGYHEPNITYRGLLAALGSITNQVLRQYNSKMTSTCTYSGLTGAGRMSLPVQLVHATTALVGAIIFLCTALMVVSRLLRTLRGEKLTIFQTAARILLSEPTRIAYLCEWLSKVRTTVREDEAGLLAVMGTARVRIGEKSKTTGDEEGGSLWIGPKGETLKIRKSRKYRGVENTGGHPMVKNWHLGLRTSQHMSETSSTGGGLQEKASNDYEMHHDDDHDDEEI
jgi:hypothetical protein